MYCNEVWQAFTQTLFALFVHMQAAREICMSQPFEAERILESWFPKYLKSLQRVSFGYTSMVSTCGMLSFVRFHSVSQG